MPAPTAIMASSSNKTRIWNSQFQEASLSLAEATKMDANKLKKLKLIEYQIPKTCGICANARIDNGKDWGTCSVNYYEHEKHSQSTRELSIYRHGVCKNDFDFDWTKAGEIQQRLQGFYEFLK